MPRLWPRGQLDISWADLAVGWSTLFARRSSPESVWPDEQSHLAMLSVRSAWDAYLGVMDWESGDEILVSEANIEDMVSIIRAHQLLPVPVPVTPETLAVDPAVVESRITGRTRAILVAHLFGSLMPLDEITAIAGQRKIPLIEDCAQAFRGTAYQGHPQATLALFSFGVIKTHTTLGGAVVFARDSSLLEKLARHTRRWPRQSRKRWLKRLVQVTALKFLSHPGCFGLAWKMLATKGHDPDIWLSGMTRGFGGEDWLHKIRQRPGHPLVRFLTYRLRRPCETRVESRRAAGEIATKFLHPELLLGQRAAQHTHWVFPIQVENPKTAATQLREHGFDASHAASRVVSLLPDSALHAALRRALFLPVYARMPKPVRGRLCKAANRLKIHHRDTEVL